MSDYLRAETMLACGSNASSLEILPGRGEKSKLVLLLDLTVPTLLAELNRNPLWQIAPHRGRNVVYLHGDGHVKVCDSGSTPPRIDREGAMTVGTCPSAWSEILLKKPHTTQLHSIHTAVEIPYDPRGVLNHRVEKGAGGKKKPRGTPVAHQNVFDSAGLTIHRGLFARSPCSHRGDACAHFHGLRAAPAQDHSHCGNQDASAEFSASLRLSASTPIAERIACLPRLRPRHGPARRAHHDE